MKKGLPETRPCTHSNGTISFIKQGFDMKQKQLKAIVFALVLVLCLGQSKNVGAQVIVETFEQAAWTSIAGTTAGSFGVAATVAAALTTSTNQTISTYTANASNATLTGTTLAPRITGNWNWVYSAGSNFAASTVGSGFRRHSAFNSWSINKGGYLITPYIPQGISSVTFWVATGGSTTTSLIGINTNTTVNTYGCYSSNLGSMPSTFTLNSSSVTGIANTTSANASNSTGGGFNSAGMYSYTVAASNTMPAQFAIFPNGSGTYITIDDIVITPALSDVTTGTAGSITTSQATISTNAIINSSASAVSVSGICWSTSANPTTADSKTTNGATTNTTWNSNATSLSSGTTYHVRAYATNGNGTYYGADISFTTTAAAANVALASSNPAIAAGNVYKSGLKSPVYAFNLGVTTNGAILNTVNFTTSGGTYASTDITKFQLWYSLTNSLSSASQIGSDINSTLGNGSHSFTGLSQSTSPGSTGYLFITADIASGATTNNTIIVSAITSSDITFSVTPTWSGSANAGGTQTIVAGNGADYFRSVASGNWSASSTWEESADNTNWSGAGTSPGASATSSAGVLIRNGHTVTIDASATLSGSLSVGEGASGVLQFEPTTARTLTVGGNVTVAAGATFQSAASGTITTHSLSVAGNITNSGIIDFSTNGNTAGADITCTGSADQLFSGTGSTTDLLTITMSKSARAKLFELSLSNFTVKGVSTAATGALVTPTSGTGTIKFSGSNTFDGNVVSSTPTIGANMGIWLNNANFTVNGQTNTTTLNGLLRITAGTYTVGSSTNAFQWGDGSVFTMEGGAFNVAARFAPSSATSTNSITFTMSGGTLTTSMGSSTPPNSSTSIASFDIPATGTTSSFTMSGGTIVMQKVSGGVDYRMSAAGTVSITGGTIQFGNASTTGSPVFKVGAAAGVASKMPNLTLNATGTPSVQLNTDIVVYGNLTIPATTSIDANSKNINITGNATQTGNWSNSGTFTNTGSTVTFDGTGAQSITKTGGETFNNLAVNKSAGTLTLSNDITTSGLTITTGTLDANTKNINVAGNWANSGTFTPSTGTVTFNGTSTISGSATTTFKNLTISGSSTLTGPSSGTMNVSGNWNNSGTFTSSTSTVGFNGTTQSYTQSGTGAFNGVTISNGTALTLNNALSINGTLTLTNGLINLGVNNLTMSTSSSVSGGSGTSHIVTASTGKVQGTYASGAVTYAVGYDASHYTPVTITNTGGVSQTYSVSAVSIAHALTNAISSSWDISTGGGTSASTLDFGWSTADASGTLNSTPGLGGAYQYVSSAWALQTSSTAIATLNTTTATGITSFTNTSWTVGAQPLQPEPSNYPTSFAGSISATSNSQTSITVTWTDATGTTLPQYYLVRAATGSYGNITTPSDATAVANGALDKNVAHGGIQTATFTGLTPGTAYYFEIFPYTNNGTLIDFKNDGTPPQITVSTAANSVATDMYRSTTTGNWSTVSLWQSSPDAGTNWVTATNVPNSTSSAVFILNSHTITLDQDASVSTLTVGGGTSGTLTYPNSTTVRNLTTASDITVASGGTFTCGTQTTAVIHTLAIGGSLAVNGTGVFTMAGSGTTKACNTTFNSSSNVTIGGTTSGTVAFNALTVNLGSSSTTITPSVLVSTASAGITLTQGKWVQSSSTTTTSGATSFAYASELLVSGGTYTANAGGITTTGGKITVSSGTLTVGNATGNSLLYDTVLVSGTVYIPTFNISGGTVNVAGRFSYANTGGRNVNFTMSGGTMTLATVGNSSSNSSFDINQGLTPNFLSTFNMSGGTIVLAQPSSTSSSDYRNLALSPTITGGTIQFGNSTSYTASDTFYVTSLSAGNNGGTLPSVVISSANTPVVQISATSGVNVVGNITINSGAKLNTNGKNLSVTGDWTDNGALINTAGGGTISLNGTSAQNITTTETFGNLTINNSSNVTLSGSSTTATTTGTLTFTSGKIVLGNNDFIPSGTISGAGSSKYFVTNGTGSVKQNVPTTNTDITYYIGPSTSLYNPIILNNFNGTADNYKVKVASGAPGNTPNADPTVMVQDSYTIAEDVNGGGNLTVKTQWGVSPSNDEGAAFDRTTNLYVARYTGTGTAWEAYAATLAGSDPYTASATGFTTVGTSGSTFITGDFIIITSGITLSDNINGQVGTGNIAQGTTANILYNFQLDVTTADAILTQLTVPFSGTYTTGDFSNMKLFYSATNSFGSASVIGTITTPTATSPQTFSSLAQTITAGTTGYFWITGDVAVYGLSTVGHTITATALAQANFTFAGATSFATGTLNSAGAQSITTGTSNVTISRIGSSDIAAGNIGGSTTNNIIYNFQLQVTTNPVTLNQLVIGTSGNYTSSDLTNLKLYYNTTNSFSGATLSKSITPAGGAGATETFGSLTQAISAGTTVYFWITADVAASPTINRTITVTPALVQAKFTLAAGPTISWTQGTLNAGGTQTIVAATASNDYFRSATTGVWATATTWESTTLASGGNSGWHIASAAPGTSATAVTIQDGHVVTINTAITTNSITINKVFTAGELSIASTGTLTVNTGMSVTVNGTLTNLNSSTTAITLSGTASMSFSSTGVYTLNVGTAGTPATTGQIPTATWNASSTININGYYGTGTNFTSTANSTYGNLTIGGVLNGTTVLWTTSGQTVAGNFTVNPASAYGGSGLLQLVSTNGTNVISIGGNYVQHGGNVLLNPSSTASVVRPMIVFGDFTIDDAAVSSPSFKMSSNTTTAYLILMGNLSLTNTAITNTGANTSNIYFAKNGTQTVTTSGTNTFTATSGSINYYVNSGSTLNMGTSVLGGTLFTTNGASTFSGVTGTYTSGATSITAVSSTAGLQPGMIISGTGFATNTVITSIGVVAGTTITLSKATTNGSTVTNGTLPLSNATASTLGIGDANGITSSGATGNVQTTTRTFATTGNYTYNGTASQATGNGLPATVNTLTINNSGNTVTMGAGITVNGDLALSAGTLAAGSNTIALAGNITGTGTHTGFGTLTMSGASKTISGATLGTLALNNASGFSLTGNATVTGTLTLTSGKLTTSSNTLAVGTAGTAGTISGGSSTAYVFGNLKEFVTDGAAPSNTFPIGDATRYAPVTIDFTGTTSGSGYLTATTTSGAHPQLASSGINTSKNASRYWTVTNSGVAGFTSYAPTFNFVAGDIIGSASTGSFVVRKYSGSAWSTTTTSTLTSTSSKATGVTSFSDFACGEQNTLTVATDPSSVSVCSAATNVTFTSSSSSTPTPTISWERNDGGGFITVNGSIDGGVYSGFTTGTLNVSAATGLNGYIYRAVFTNINGSVNSASATLTVNAVQSGTVSGTQTLCNSGTPTNLTKSFSGGAGTASYQWVDNGSTNSNSGGTDISSNGTSATYAPITTSNGTKNYYLKVTYSGSGCGTVASSNAIAVTVNAIQSGTVSGTQTICKSSTPTDLTKSFSNGAGTASYQWYSNTSNSNSGGTLLGGETSATYTPVTTTSGVIYYYVTVAYSGSGCGTVASSNTAAVTVSPITWTGASSTDWSVAGNWCGGTPASGDNVVIANVGTLPTLVANTTVGNITLNGKLTLGGYDFTVNGAFSGSSSLVGSNTSNLILTSSSSAGTVNFDQTTDASVGTTDGSNALWNLIHSGSGEVSIGSKLNVFNKFDNSGDSVRTGGYLVLRSTASNTAYVAANTAKISGLVTVERYVHATRRAWRLLTAPLTQNGTSCSATIQSNWQSEFGYTNTHGYGTNIYGPPYLATGAPNGYDGWTNSNSVLSYDPNSGSTGGYVGITSTTGENMFSTATSAANKAYLLFVRGDKTVTATSSSSNPHSYVGTTLAAKGNLQTGTQSFNINNYNGKFVMLGNPYASPVDMESVFNNAETVGLDGNVYTWDPNLGSPGVNASVGGYCTFNSSTWVPSSGSQSKYLQSGQGFFVVPSSNTASVVFKESNKATSTWNNTNTTGAGNGLTDLFRVKLNFIKAEDGSKYLADGTLAVFKANFTKAVANEDGPKLKNGSENLSFKRNGSLLAIEGHPFINGADTLFVNFSGLKADSAYELQVEPTNFDATVTSCKLVDHYLATETPMSLNSTTLYPFTVTASAAASSATNRFEFIFNGSGPLPNNGIAVKAAQKEKTVIVNWEATAENGVRNYNVEKSTNGKDFAKLNTQTAKNGSSNNAYNYTDMEPVQGSNYYRIKATDMNDNIRYSQTVKVDIGSKLNAGIAIYPNPSKGNNINVQLTNVEKGICTAIVVDMNGKQVASINFNHEGGSAARNLGLNTTIATGTYTIKVSDNKGNSYQTKLIVE